MEKDYSFYRVHLERENAVDGEPGLLAATEVVQAVCDAGFQRDGFIMKSYDSSPRCYYKYAKTPKEGMYMMRAVKKTDMTTLNILIDTRMYPSLVMVEKQTDWQDETEEVIVTLEQIINDDTYKFNWRMNLQKHTPQSTQNLKEFFSALSYMENIEDTDKKNYFYGTTQTVVYGDYYACAPMNNGVEKEQGKKVDRIATKEMMSRAAKITLDGGYWKSQRSWSVVFVVYCIWGYKGRVSDFLTEVADWPDGVADRMACNRDAVEKLKNTYYFSKNILDWRKDGVPEQYCILGEQLNAELEKMSAQPTG